MENKRSNKTPWILAGALFAGLWIFSRDDNQSRYDASDEMVEIPTDSEEDPSASEFPLATDVPDSALTQMDSEPTTSVYGGAGIYSSDNAYNYYTSPSITEEEEEEAAPRYFDEREAKRMAERKMARRGYDGSFGCTIDCSGHEAGWQYRAENRYPTYGSLDYGNSESFAEGAQAYERAVKKEVERSRQDFELGDDEYATSFPSF